MERIALLTFQMTGNGWVPSLDKALAGLTPEQASWSPAPGDHSIREIVSHLTFWKEIVTRRLHGAPLTGGPIANPTTFQRMGETPWAEAAERLLQAHQALRDAVAAVADEDLDRPLPGEPTPLRELLAGLVQHDGYHIGQIILIRKLQGSWGARTGD